MKKLLLLAIAGLFSFGAQAQIIAHPDNSGNVEKYGQTVKFDYLVRKNVNKSYYKNETKTVTYDYLTAATTLGGTTPGTQNSRAPIFPDSSIYTIYSGANGVTDPYFHGFGQSFDASCPYFGDDTALYKNTVGNSFRWDSLSFLYQYNRASNSKIVDTLFISYLYRTYDKKNLSRTDQGLFEARFTSSGIRTIAPYADTVLNLPYLAVKRDTILLTEKDSTINTTKVINRKIGRSFYPKTVLGFYANYKPGYVYKKNLKDTLFDFSTKDSAGNPRLIIKKNTFWSIYTTESNTSYEADSSFNHAFFFTSNDKYKNTGTNGGRPSYVQAYNFRPGTYDKLHVISSIVVSATFNSVEEIAKNGGYAVSNIFPNPTNGNIPSIDITVPKSQNVTFTLTNLLGKTISSKNTTINSGDSRLTLEVADLIPGVYFYTVSTGNYTSTKKFTVSK